MAVYTAPFAAGSNQGAFTENGVQQVEVDRSFLRVGMSGTRLDSRFALLLTNVQIARGRVIASAPLTMIKTGQNGSQPNPELLLSAEDVASGAKAASGAAFYAKARLAEANYGQLPTSATGSAVTFDITAQIQAVIDRLDWVPGNDILIIARASDPAAAGFFNFGNTNSTNTPTLTITHFAPIAGTVTAARRRRTALITGTSTTPQITGNLTATRPRRTASLTGETQKQLLVTGQLTVSRPRRAAQIQGQMTQPVTTGQVSAARIRRAIALTGAVQNYSYTGSLTVVRPRRSATITGGIPIRFSGEITARRPHRRAKLDGFLPPSLTVVAKPILTPHIRLLNRSREVLAVLDVSNPPTWSRKRNEATEINVEVPRGDIKLPYTQVANLIEIWLGERRLIGGRISGRDVGSELVTIRAMSEEILLEQHLCPVNYSQIFSNVDLADVARRCLDSWHTLRTGRDWTTRQVGMSNVDLTTQPGMVMLRRVNGAYVRSGYIYQRFSKREIPRFKDWERVRWSSDFDDPVFTTLQFGFWRSGVFSGWRPARLVSVGNTTGLGIRGVLPDSYGQTLAEASDADYLDIACRLYTDDTESQEDGQETAGVTPLFYGLEVVARTHGFVSEGSIPNSAGVTVKSVEASANSALAILRVACEQTGHEFRVESGKLSIAKEFGRSRVDDFLLIG